MEMRKNSVKRPISIFVFLIFFGVILILMQTGSVKADRYVEAPDIPGTPDQYYPWGDYSFVRPTFIWEDVTDGDQYHLLVSHAAIGTVHNTWYVESSVCPGAGGGSGECGLISPDHMRTGNHTWWVRAKNEVGNGYWSSGMNFRIWNTTPPSGTVSLFSPSNDAAFDFYGFPFIWGYNERATWYKVYMSDSEGKLYNQYHRAAELCNNTNCLLPSSVYNSLLHAPRALSELPTDRWIHWYVMPVNVAGNGSWSADYKFWLYTP